MGATEMIRGVGVACALLLVCSLAVLPVTEEPPILASFREELVRWTSAEAAEWGAMETAGDESPTSLAQLVLTQRAVKLKREVRRLTDASLLANASSAVPRFTEATDSGAHTKHAAFSQLEQAGKKLREPEQTTVLADAPRWRAEHSGAKQIFYLHIWKCGGTNMCKVARINGEAANPDWGCHAPDSTRSQGWKPCTDPKPFSVTSPELTFVGSECPLKGTEPFDDPHWTFVAILRNPLTQATSWYLHARQVMKGKLPTFFEWVKKKKTARGIFFEQFEDNLQTRFICGWTCNEKPVLDEGDLEKAKANLAKFQVVLRLEEFNEPGGLQAVTDVLGWTAVSAEDHSVGTHRHVTQEQAEAKFPNAAKYLQEQLKWDFALYEYSKTLPHR